MGGVAGKKFTHLGCYLYSPIATDEEDTCGELTYNRSQSSALASPTAVISESSTPVMPDV
ncbi:hypothetical protein GCM10022627_03190 [Haloarcula argentinensis]